MEPFPFRRIVFPAKQKVLLEEVFLEPPKPGEVRVRTLYSLMSTGTENIVFNRLFDEGTHWDEWVKYPFHPGYCAAGVVETAGTNFSPGDRVVFRGGHGSHAHVSEDALFPLPAGIDDAVAPWFALAKIAFQGARAACYQLGHSVLILGAGPIGQMSIRWARAAGATAILVVDPLAERAPMAAAGGATATISLPADQAREAVLANNEGRLPQVVIDSTGHPQVFGAALGLAGQFGKVVLLGDTGTPANQRLTFDVIFRGLTIVGAHDCHNSETWNDRTITRLFLKLVQSGRFSMDGLNTHTFRPEDCGEAYHVANHDRAKTMGILFDWRASA
jgi:2-desacetyl-2-hydroxyethyl bacteriochlorophyllide A dehydrogenase